MVLMALDHSRDFFSNSAAVFDPTDLSRATPLLFFTRWITHFCAPVFIFLAGTGAYLWQEHGRETCKLAKYLATRGLWLILLEIFVISPLGWSFSFSFGFTRLQVIWVIGVSMILLVGEQSRGGRRFRAWPGNSPDARVHGQSALLAQQVGSVSEQTGTVSEGKPRKNLISASCETPRGSGPQLRR
jgi:hypothetical protein